MSNCLLFLLDKVNALAWGCLESWEKYFCEVWGEGGKDKIDFDILTAIFIRAVDYPVMFVLELV